MAVPTYDDRRCGPADLVTADVTPELLVCTALVRCGLVDGAGASLILDPTERIGLAATDEAFVENAEMQFSNWEGPGPEVVASGRPVVVEDLHAEGARWPLTTPHAVTTRMRALATFPLSTRLGVVGLFAAYRARPGLFTSVEIDELRAAAAAVGVLVAARFDELATSLYSPPRTLA